MQVDADFLGDYLRQERESRRVSLQDISAATKVQLKFLEALEQDDYDRLPPTPFVVGFLRAYAQCLRLDPEEIIAAYHERYGSSTNPAGHRLPVAYRVKRSRPMSWKGIGIAIVVVLLIGGGVWRALRRGQGGGATPDPARLTAEQTLEASQNDSQVVALRSEVRRPQPLESAVVSEPEAAAPAIETPLPAAVVTTVGNPGPEPSAAVIAASPSETVPPSPAPLVLQAIAVEDTWLRVEIDGDERHAVLLTAGKQVQWEADERFVLKIGNAQGTRLRLNGQEVRLPPTRDNVVRNFVLTRDGVR